MIWALWVPVWASVALVALSPGFCRWVPPRVAAPVLCAAMTAAAAGWVLSCCVLAGVALVRVPLVGALLTRRDHAAGAHVPSVSAAVVAGALLMSSCVLVARSLRSHVVQARTAARITRGGEPVLVLAEEAVAAYAVGGWPGRGTIVTTRGLVEALSPAECAAVLAHESAHLRRGHRHLVLASQLAALANPLLRAKASTVAYLCERDADEQAAAVIGDRKVAAHALGRAALAGHRRRTSFLSFTDRGVPARVRALLRPAPNLAAPGQAILLVTTLLIASLAFGAADTVHDADRLLELLRRQ